MTGWAVLEALGVGVAVLLLAWTLLLYVPLRWWPVGRYLWIPKLAVPAAIAAVGAVIVVVRLGRVRAERTGALGPGWEQRIPGQHRAPMVGRGWGGRLPNGGAWCALDKDVATRPLFRHLAAQGHLIVDVAHRLFPETDLPGMVADTKTSWPRPPPCGSCTSASSGRAGP